MNRSNFNYETSTFILTTPNSSISFFIFHQNFHSLITPKTHSFLPNLSVMENGPTYPKYYYFPIVKIYPFLKFFIGGGIALSANFLSKFWSIFSTNSHDYFNQKLILLHLGAKDSYYYDFLVIPILAFIFDEKTSLLFAHKITYNTSQHENGPTFPKYYYFPIVKIDPFLKFFIGGGAKYFYYYDFLVIQILAFIFDQKTSLLFSHKITYITSEHVITKFSIHILSYNSLLSLITNISLSKCPFSPSTLLAQLTCTSKHLGGVLLFGPIFPKNFGPFFQLIVMTTSFKS
ncbi:hypothetical protein PFBG_06138 [Plasmodium falciparum 7G8]|uniref:Uncharacterized protein n=1 Tax=Plasmodium falciparum (isolate 7G8) TaxID=57266 RepID=W7FCA4_PLAF8|nr:hypothetical protein PFBG_06138 [Plasmodium falciparum 7G8]